MARINTERVAAWLVHAYTAMGLVCAWLAYMALRAENETAFFLWLAAAVLIDSTDGALARKARASEVLPEFDGRKLDDITDYITYVLLPMFAVVEMNLLPDGFYWIAIIPLLASGYGFNQERAKTEDAFVGFPSYWNVVLFYLVALKFSPTLNAALLLFLSALVFWPVHYVYPTRARRLMGLTLALAGIWGIAVLISLLTLGNEASYGWALFSLFFPVYYIVLSAYHHREIMRQ